MKCANCGGTINLNENCPDCGIDYSEMLKKVRHTEMRRLFVKMKDLDRKHKCTDIEESLLACELANSSLIMPARIEGDSFTPAYVGDSKNNNNLILFTDMDAFEGIGDIGAEPLTVPWQSVFSYIEEGDGVVINIFDECCCISTAFLRQYFADNLNTS